MEHSAGKKITFNFVFRRWFNEKVTKHINVREYRRGNQNQNQNKKSRETDNMGYTRPRKTKQKTQHNMCWASLFANKHK